MAGWQWHEQIICASLQTDNRACTSSLDFLQAGWSFWHPTISVKATTMLCAAATENLRWLSAFKASCKGPRVGHPRLPTLVVMKWEMRITNVPFCSAWSCYVCLLVC